MTFTPVLTMDPNPLVRIFFCGLTIIKPAANGSTCEVFMHRTALNHTPSVEVRLKRPGRRDVLVMRHLGPLEFATPVSPNPVAEHGLLIRTTAARGVRGYEGGPIAEGNSIRTALDLNNLHRGKTTVDRPVGQPSVFLNDAVFYAADSTEADLHIDLHRGGVFVRELTPFANLIGANIYDSEVTVVWRQSGVLETMRLTTLPAGWSYEIFVINNPPYERPPAPGTQPHDELQEYYRMLPAVPHPERYNLVFRMDDATPASLVSSKLDDRGSLRTPCMSVVDDS